MTNDLKTFRIFELGVETSDLSLINQALACGLDPNRSYKVKTPSPTGIVFKSSSGTALRPCSKGEIEMMQLLIKHGGDPNLPLEGFNAETMKEISIFYLACYSGNESMTSLFLENCQIDLLKQAPKELTNSSGWLVSMSAVRQFGGNVLDKIQDSFEKNIWPNHPHLDRYHLWTAKNSMGLNALMTAVDNINALNWLLDNQRFNLCDLINTKNKFGQTVLHEAVKQGSYDCVELLISKGAWIDVKDNDDLTPLDHARLMYQKTLELNSKTTFVVEWRKNLVEFLTMAQASQLASQSIHQILKRSGLNLTP